MLVYENVPNGSILEYSLTNVSSILLFVPLETNT